MSIHFEEMKSRDEWKAARTTIGGSDAAALIGKSPYMSNVDLWEIKTGRKQAADLSENELVDYGHEAEPLLRNFYRLDHPEYEVAYFENTIIRNDKYPFAHASVDGLIFDTVTGEKGVLEIKTANLLSGTQFKKWAHGNVPVNYLIQVLWYMAITESSFAVVNAQLKGVRWLGDDCKVTIERIVRLEDHASDITYLMTQGRQFWEYVKNDQRPPMILDI